MKKSEGKRNYLFIIPFGLPAYWLADYEKKTAEEISRKYPVVSFLIGEGFSLLKYITHPRALLYKTSRHSYIFKPLYIVPLQRFRPVREINFRLAVLELRFMMWTNRDFRKRKKVFWSFSLQDTVFPRQFGSNITSLYDCIDDFVSEDPQLRRAWSKREQSILRQTDIVFCNSKVLFALKQPLHERVHFVPGGFDLRSFRKNFSTKAPQDIASIPDPIIGFVGYINKRLDFPLILALVRAMPDVSFVFIGREDPLFIGKPGADFQSAWSHIRSRSNVYFLGEKPRKHIPRYIAHFSVGAIYYDVTQRFNLNCLPMKLSEYFYAGIPVISTPIKEVFRFQPYVTILKTPTQAVRAIEALISSPWPDSYRRAQRGVARQHSWEQKVLEMLKILDAYSESTVYHETSARL